MVSMVSMGWDAAVAPTACVEHLATPPSFQPEDVRAERPRLTHQPCPRLSWPPARGAAGDGKRALAWMEMKGGSQLRTPDATCPGCAGSSQDVLAPVGSSPSGRGGAGSADSPCRELPARPAAEEPHGPPSPRASCPGRAAAGSPRATESPSWLNPPRNGHRQPPPCLSLPSAKRCFSQMSPLGRGGGCPGHEAVGVGGGPASQPPPAGTYPVLPLQLRTRMLSREQMCPKPPRCPVGPSPSPWE